MVIKAIIFDVDGVLVDSAEANAIFFQNLVSEFGYEPTLEKDFQARNHLPMWDRIAVMIGSNDEKKIRPIWEYGKERAAYPVNKVRFPKRLAGTLRLLGKRYRLGIVTGRIKEGLDEYFELTGTRQHFSIAVCYEDTENRKPHPEPLLRAATLLKVKPSESIYVGDADTDVQAAKAAGMHSILVARHRNPDADKTVPDWDGIIGAVAQLAEPT